MAGAGMAKSLVVVVATALMILVKGIMAEELIVGGIDGWRLQPSSPDFYKTWAKEQTFGVGDVLVFKFGTGSHTVAETTSKIVYDNCTSDDPSVKLTTDGPAKITLDKEGTVFFFCTVGQHCAKGQKFTAIVGPAKAPSPSPSKSPSSGSFPQSFIISTFSLSALLALVMALIY